MLKPFQIRDLHIGESNDIPELVPHFIQTADHHFPSRRHGVVQLASSDYDELALSHPRARLTYVDDDDGDLITVGSSFELSQRLDEPALPSTPLNAPQPMHIFDIRRSSSVTELWKKFEHHEIQDSDNTPMAQGTTTDDTQTATQDEPKPEPEQTRTAASEETSQPLLAAFEAEMAKILWSSGNENNAPRATPSFVGTETDPRSDRPQNPSDAFAYAMRNLIEGAELISSGVRSRIPEFERHLRNAQRALPENVGSSVQTAFTALETQVRNITNALNNASSAGAQGAESLFHGQLPTAASTVDGLRTMASELGNMGQTLFEAFESELRGNASRNQNQVLSSEPVRENTEQTRTMNPPQAPSPTPSSRTLSLYSDSIPERQPNAAVPPRTQHPATFQYHSYHPETPGNTSHPANPFAPGQFPAHGFPAPPSFPHIPPFHHHPHPHHSWFPGPNHHHHRPPPIVPPGFIAPIQPIYFETSVFNPRSPNFWARGRHHPDWRRGRHGHGSPASRTTLFIGNVGFNVNERMICDVFAAKGLLVEVNLPLDSGTSRHAGFGYLHFPSMEAATAALEALQGLIIDGHSINLESIDHTPVTMVPQSDARSQAASQTGPEPRARADASSHSHPEVAPQVPSPSSELETPSADAEMLNTLYPSLLPQADRRPAARNPSLSEILPDLAETEARFPPVSQHDAHVIAGQPRESESAPRTATSPPPAQPEESPERRALNSDPSPQSLPGSFPQDCHDESRLEPALLANRWACQFPTSSPSVPNLHFHGRRAASTRSAHPPRGPHNSFGPVNMGPGGGPPHPLRRRNTERHSLQNNPPMAPHFPRHRPSFYHPPHPVSPLRPNPPPFRDEIPEQSPERQRAIAECVARLVSLGYGSEQEGGPQRITVYAAAADGEVADAIEMIEEERKAYEQRRSTQ